MTEEEREERMKPVLDRIPEQWGKSLPDEGWDEILLELDTELAALDPGYVVYQAKEKWGELRFYAESKVLDWKQVDAVVRPYEERSRVTCERCGAPGEKRPGGWIKTLCDEHAVKR